MEGWLILVGIFGGIAFIGWLSEKYQEYKEAERVRIRDDVASNLLTEHGITNEVFEQIDKYTEYVYRSLPGKVQHSDPLELNTPAKVHRQPGKVCPKCNMGVLVRRQGKYGYFFGCTNYPRCTNTERDVISNKKARDAEKNTVAKGFLEDIEKAYS
jgi:hypothetical protein